MPKWTTAGQRLTVFKCLAAYRSEAATLVGIFLSRPALDLQISVFNCRETSIWPTVAPTVAELELDRQALLNVISMLRWRYQTILVSPYCIYLASEVTGHVFEFKTSFTEFITSSMSLALLEKMPAPNSVKVMGCFGFVSKTPIYSETEVTAMKILKDEIGKNLVIQIRDRQGFREPLMSYSHYKQFYGEKTEALPAPAGAMPTTHARIHHALNPWRHLVFIESGTNGTALDFGGGLLENGYLY
jgi:hypothetical protein